MSHESNHKVEPKTHMLKKKSGNSVGIQNNREWVSSTLPVYTEITNVNDHGPKRF